jgi:hypothetical protein
MAFGRVSVGKLMVAIGLIAINAGAFRALSVRNLEVAIGMVLMVLALQVGLWFAIRRPTRSRGFWIGFVAVGVVGPLTFLWTIVATTPGPFRLPALYLEYSINLMLLPAQRHLRPFRDNLFVNGASFGLISFLAQMPLALVGGLLGSAIRPSLRLLGPRSSVDDPGSRLVKDKSSDGSVSNSTLRRAWV